MTWSAPPSTLPPLYKAPVADRAAVSLDQTASPHSPLSRQQRQRDPSPALRRDDRLRAAAHRRPQPLHQDLDPALHRSGRPVPLRAPPPSAAIDKPPPVNPSRPQCQKFPKISSPSAMPDFPRTALRKRGRVREGGYSVSSPSVGRISHGHSDRHAIMVGPASKTHTRPRGVPYSRRE